MKFAFLTLGLLIASRQPRRRGWVKMRTSSSPAYGQPLKETDQKGEGTKVASADVIFQKGGFQINVTLVDGVSVSESFWKINGDPLSIGEVRTLLSANTQGRVWQAPVVVRGDKVWLRDDDATAALLRSGTELLIKSKALISAQAEAKQLEQKPTLDGF